MALNKVSFEAKSGEVLGILGANGAGKTTLLRIITGIINPTAGAITMGGQLLNYDLILKNIGYLPEERGLYKNMKAIDTVVFLASLKNISRTQALDFVKAKSIDLEIDFDINKPVGSFSKGMQQKVQLLAATVHHPKLLILDEPFSGLDPMNSQVIKKEIVNMAQSGTTILMSTHRMDTFEDLCSSFLFLRKGEVLAKGAKADLMPSQLLLKVVTKSPLSETLFQFEKQMVSNGLFEYWIKAGDSTNVIAQKIIEQQADLVSIAPHADTLEDVFIKMNKNLENA